MIRHGQVSNDNDSGYGITLLLLHCLSQEVALSGHDDGFLRCPLSGVKRTFESAAAMSINDP
jgi:hypothetical protein